uniref:Uncharacterized protein n=1 Tax=Glossina palpalis gambiensis TaxID=67801 RepID=A0A1B0BTP1_9MUSC
MTSTTNHRHQLRRPEDGRKEIAEKRRCGVQFDEVYTNKTSVYSRAEDVLRGCDYSNKSETKTMEHGTVLVFAARSLLTAFNILLNSYPCTSHSREIRPLTNKIRCRSPPDHNSDRPCLRASSL